MNKQQTSLFPEEKKLIQNVPAIKPEIITRKNVKLKGIQKIVKKEHNLYSTFELYGIYLIEVEVILHKRFNKKVEIVYKKTNKKIEKDQEVLGRIKRELHTKSKFTITSIKKLKFLGHGVKE